MSTTATGTETYRDASFESRSPQSVPRQYVPRDLYIPTGYTPTSAAVPSRPGAAGLPVIGHDAEHGFCTVCGAVWPCARARRDQRAAELSSAPAAERAAA
jgi:hypothetical protein